MLTKNLLDVKNWFPSNH